MPALPSLISMMSQLIASPSISCSQAHWDQSNKGVIQLLESWLSSQGFQCEIMPLPHQPDKFNLIATLGSGDGGLVLAGHTDTVPYDEGRWQSDPFSLEERDQKLYGLGSCDMKGFFAIVLDTVQAMQLSNLKQPLIILATADEESSMSGARALVERGSLKARYALIGEPTSLTPIYAHKGIMMERIQITGQAGHSSNPSLGNNALDAMHEVMSELMIFRQQLKKDYRDASFVIDYPTMNFGCLHGGDNPNRICGRCELEFDLRALPGMSNQALMAEIAQLLPRIEEKTGTKIQLNSLFPDVPSFYTPIESDIIKACEALTKRQASTVAFATEGSFLNQMGMETLILGPGSIDQAHQPNEFMALDQIQPMQQVIRGLIERFCLQPNKQENEEQRA
ncbi:acetylornithine deacetylase [Marinomonas primoryensis]|jgi:acetylornithine deacetylase|uniref:Acetylornithine deacetylase n=1 Tax=Marinomonas primoryensis TaxID=178399 RepID=A0A2Z4PWJ6_9GAMM|nr:acetylornithine deacetylase [Marinomonas primoryensis]AWY01873.1 acetylornithine deacetylase [Marinomonas primoryensis]QKK81638.1 N-acetylornithine deacetylase [Marinomonas primoryensis]|tara:strand:- start:23662 stop:24846 length:1185 start_codon:yes stop_codon:yes gene_type:complete